MKNFSLSDIDNKEIYTNFTPPPIIDWDSFIEAYNNGKRYFEFGDAIIQVPSILPNTLQFKGLQIAANSLCFVCSEATEAGPNLNFRACSFTVNDLAFDGVRLYISGSSLNCGTIEFRNMKKYTNTIGYSELQYCAIYANAFHVKCQNAGTSVRPVSCHIGVGTLWINSGELIFTSSHASIRTIQFDDNVACKLTEFSYASMVYKIAYAQSASLTVDSTSTLGRTGSIAPDT